jgi:HAD superfamily phosphoserine phosphatase-like hydrolase
MAGLHRAIFADVDHTLVRGKPNDLFSLTVKEAVNERLLPREVYYGPLATQAWHHWMEGTITQHAYAMTIYRAFVQCNGFVGVTTHQLQELGRRILERHGNAYFTFPRQLLEAATRAGYRTIAISGSPTQVVQAVTGNLFERVVGTEWCTNEQGQILGTRLSCDPVNEGKEKIVAALSNQLDLDPLRSIAIGDSASDAKMLSACGYPIAFNPIRPLLEEARERHWLMVQENPYDHSSMAFMTPRGSSRFAEVSPKDHLPPDLSGFLNL